MEVGYRESAVFMGPKKSGQRQRSHSHDGGGPRTQPSTFMPTQLDLPEDAHALPYTWGHALEDTTHASHLRELKV